MVPGALRSGGGGRTAEAGPLVRVTTWLAGRRVGGAVAVTRAGRTRLVPGAVWMARDPGRVDVYT